LSLEERVVPTIDVILDFDGGSLQSGQGYNFPAGFGAGGGNSFTAWTGFNSSNPPATAERTAQLLQIVAGVREDFADFDVRVIWDDLGANSPHFDGVDTVIMVVAENNPGAFGVAPLDLTQTSRDVCLVFGPVHEGLFPDTMARSMREIIDTASHETGHTLGLSHSSQADSQQRQIVTIAPQNTNLDSRFSSEPLNHAGPEPGIVYSERDRLTQNVGNALPGTTLISMETATGQTLLQDTMNTFVSGPNAAISIAGSIDFAGDRDAYRLTLETGGVYTLRQRAINSGIIPVLTVWGESGNFIATASAGAAGGFSETTFNATPGQVIYVIAGTGYDQLGTGVIGTPTIGAYVFETGIFVPPDPPPPPPPVFFGAMATALDAGGLPSVQVIDLNTGATIRQFNAYDPRFNGGVRVAFADVNGDGVRDVITAPGAGGGPHIRVFSGVNFQQLTTPIGSFLAYDPGFFGGIYVAAGDINADGAADIITAAGAGGGPHVRVFSGATGDVITEFMAYDLAFRGGVTVATGDVNGDGQVDILTGAGPGGGPHVLAFDGATRGILMSLFAYALNFSGGVFVSSADVNGDGRSDIVTGAGQGGSSHIRVFDSATTNPYSSFLAFPPATGSAQFVGDSNYNGGVRILSRDITGDGFAEIIAVTGAGSRPRARFFSGTGSPLGGVDPFHPAFLGGVFVG
jgi:hypothetical protein